MDKFKCFRGRIVNNRLVNCSGLNVPIYGKVKNTNEYKYYLLKPIKHLYQIVYVV